MVGKPILLASFWPGLTVPLMLKFLPSIWLALLIVPLWIALRIAVEEIICSFFLKTETLSVLKLAFLSIFKSPWRFLPKVKSWPMVNSLTLIFSRNSTNFAALISANFSLKGKINR